MSRLIFTATEKYSLNHFVIVTTNNSEMNLTVKEAIDRFFDLIEKHRDFVEIGEPKINFDSDALVYYIGRKNKLLKLNPTGKKINSSDFVFRSLNRTLSKYSI